MQMLLNVIAPPNPPPETPKNYKIVFLVANSASINKGVMACSTRMSFGTPRKMVDHGLQSEYTNGAPAYPDINGSQFFSDLFLRA